MLLFYKDKEYFQLQTRLSYKPKPMTRDGRKHLLTPITAPSPILLCFLPDFCLPCYPPPLPSSVLFAYNLLPSLRSSNNQPLDPAAFPGTARSPIRLPPRSCNELRRTRRCPSSSVPAQSCLQAQVQGSVPRNGVVALVLQLALDKV